VPHSSRTSLVDRLTGGPERRRRRRHRELEARLRGLERCARARRTEASLRGFLVDALARYRRILEALPQAVRLQGHCLAWRETVTAALERQVQLGGLSPSGPGPAALPTTVAEERRLASARSAVAGLARRAGREREELLDDLAEVEASLA
jgi:hypothetical protein